MNRSVERDNRWSGTRRRRSNEEVQGTAVALSGMRSHSGCHARRARWRALGGSRGSGQLLYGPVHLHVPDMVIATAFQSGSPGVSQVSELRGDTSIQDRAWFDNHYIENWTVGGDLAILARTAGAMIKQVRD